MEFSYIVTGLLVGFTVGLTGVGGGSLMTPLLVLVFGVKPIVAVGTDLLYAAVTKSGGIWVHGRRGTVQWRIVGLLASGSIPASVITITLMQRLEASGFNFDKLITGMLGTALILTSLALLFKGHLQRLGQDERFAAIRTMHRRFLTPLTIAAGALLGGLVTLSSVGAGALGAAILFFLYPRLPAIAIVGTDLAHAVPLTAAAGLGHLQLGSVDLPLLLNLLIGSLPGVYLGSLLGMRIPERVMRPALASMLLMIGVRFAFAL